MFICQQLLLCVRPYGKHFTYINSFHHYTNAEWWYYYYYSHFTNEETEAQLPTTFQLQSAAFYHACHIYSSHYHLGGYINLNFILTTYINIYHILTYNFNNYNNNSYIYIFAAPHGLQDLSSLMRDRTRAMAVEAQNPNHQATRGLPSYPYF